MSQSFEYRVCQMQQSRVSFVNGAWQGTKKPVEETALESCPWIWDYLQAAGAHGWELASTLNVDTGASQLLFLKRTK